MSQTTNLTIVILTLCLSTLSTIAEPVYKWHALQGSAYRGSLIRETEVKSGNFGSQVTEMKVRAYLPPGYHNNTQERYPVLYMVDGQNIFQKGNKDWLLDERLTEMIGQEGSLRPIIVVTIDTPDFGFRTTYMPSRRTKSENSPAIGGGSEHLIDFIKDLKVGIDNDFRTVHDDTGIMGASLGGIFALHASHKYPRLFNRAAALSPSLWLESPLRIRLGGEPMVTFEQAKNGPRRLWIDMGDNEADDPLKSEEYVRDLRYFEQFFRLHRNQSLPFQSYIFREDHQDDHDEWSWGARSVTVLKWLYTN